MNKLDAGFKGTQKQAEKFATATANIGRTASAAGRSAEGAAKKTNKFVASIARIAKYRLIRSVIRGITDAIKQGAEWFYNFSKNSKEGLVGFASAMDSVKASGNMLKAQLGAAFGTLYANIAPILNSLIGLAIKFANVITMVFAKLSGASGWYRAASAADALADSVGGAGSAAKEALRYLAPFDELNRLPADNGSGGGGGGGANNGGSADYEWVDFEQYDIGQGIADIVSHITNAFNNASDWLQGIDWYNLGQTIFDKFDEAVQSADWSELVKSIFRLMGSAVGAVGGLAAGFAGSAIQSIIDALSGETDNKRTLLEAIGEDILDPIWDGFVAASGLSSRIDWDQDFHLWQEIKDSFETLFTGISINFEGIKDQFTLFKAWVSDNVWRGIKQAFIDYINGMSEGMLSFINDCIDALNELPSGFKQFFGLPEQIDPIPLKLIPDLDPPVGAFYEQTKADIEAKSMSKPVGYNATAKLTGYNRAELKTPEIPSTAQFTKTKNSLSGMPTFSSKANFTKTKNSLGTPSFKSKANFTSKVISSSLQDRNGRMLINSAAKIVSVDNRVGTITVNAKARVTGYTQEVQATGGVFHGGKWDKIQRFAGGGLANGSQLFWARERGPELVGTLGSHTAVMNNDQIVASVSAGVARAIAGIRFSLTGLGVSSGGLASEDAMYNAMLRALNDSDAFDVEVDLDGDAVYRSMVRKNRRETFRMGYNPMMANG